MNKYEIYARDENFSLTIKILAGSIIRASEIAKDAFIARYPNSKRENIPETIVEKEYIRKVPEFKKENSINACVFKDSDIDNESKYQNIYSYQEDTKYLEALPNVINKYSSDLKNSSLKTILVGQIGGLNLVNIHTDYSLNVVNSYTVAFLHSL